MFLEWEEKYHVPSSAMSRVPCAAPHRLEQTGLRKALVQVIEEAENLGGFNRIERLADVIIAGDALDLEQRPGVVAAGGFFHVLLETEEGRTLREEDRQRRGGPIGHGVEGIPTRARVRQSGGDGSPASQQIFEAPRMHAPRDAGTVPKVQVTIG